MEKKKHDFDDLRKHISEVTKCNIDDVLFIGTADNCEIFEDARGNSYRIDYNLIIWEIDFAE